MKVLVTGGCGFIGANLVRQLLDSSVTSIRVLDNLSRGKLDNVSGLDIEGVVQADITDFDAIMPAFEGMDAVIHLAAYGSVVESVASPEQNFDINVAGTFNVLRAASQQGVKRLVFASTGGALIGNAEPPVNEDSVPRPISPYGASKLACEGYCCAFANSYGMAITALRFANVIGPFSEHKKGAVTAFMKAVHTGKPIHIYGDGSASRDFLHVNDLCHGIGLALESASTGFNVYHLASGKETTVKELAEKILEVTGHKGHEILFHDKRQGEVDRNFATYDRARAALGFEPRCSLEESLRDTWDWFLREIENFGE